MAPSGSLPRPPDPLPARQVPESARSSVGSEQVFELAKDQPPILNGPVSSLAGPVRRAGRDSSCPPASRGTATPGDNPIGSSPGGAEAVRLPAARVSAKIGAAAGGNPSAAPSRSNLAQAPVASVGVSQRSSPSPQATASGPRSWTPASYAAVASARQAPATASSSFASIAAQKKPPVVPLFPPIALARRQYGVKDGKPSVSFTATEIRAGSQHLAHALVAKFSSGRPEIGLIRRHFLQSWPLKNRATIGLLGPRHVLITYTCKEDASNALVSLSRQIGNSLFRLFRWTPDFSTRKESTRITTWVRLPDLLPDLFDQSFIEGIVSSFGTFLDVDERTKLMETPSCARACVEVDIKADLPANVWVDLPDGRSYWQQVIYESKMMYCNRCKLHGHSYDSCRKRRPSTIAPPNPSTAQQEDSNDTQKAPSNSEELKSAQAPKASSDSMPPEEGKNEGWNATRRRRRKEKKLAESGAAEVLHSEATLAPNAPLSHQEKDSQASNSRGAQKNIDPANPPSRSTVISATPPTEGAESALIPPGDKTLTDKSNAKTRDSSLLDPFGQVNSFQSSFYPPNNSIVPRPDEYVSQQVMGSEQSTRGHIRVSLSNEEEEAISNMPLQTSPIISRDDTEISSIAANHVEEIHADLMHLHGIAKRVEVIKARSMADPQGLAGKLLQVVTQKTPSKSSQ